MKQCNMKLRTLLFILAISSAMTQMACVGELICVDGHGPKVTRTIHLPEIIGVSLEEAARVHIHQSDSQYIEVTGHENIMDMLETEVINGIWAIDLRDKCYSNLDLEVRIGMKELRRLFLAGSGDVTVGNFDQQSDLDVVLTGSGDIRLGGFSETKELDVVLTGSGDMRITDSFGSLEKLNLLISGSGDFDAYPATSRYADVTISGSGDARIQVTELLKIVLTGSGDVYFKGSPQVDATISGSGRYFKVN